MSVEAELRVVELEQEQRENTRTIIFLAELLGKTLGERDRARDLAARLEARLAESHTECDPLD